MVCFVDHLQHTVVVDYVHVAERRCHQSRLRERIHEHGPPQPGGVAKYSGPVALAHRVGHYRAAYPESALLYHRRIHGGTDVAPDRGELSGVAYHYEFAVGAGEHVLQQVVKQSRHRIAGSVGGGISDHRRLVDYEHGVGQPVVLKHGRGTGYGRRISAVNLAVDGERRMRRGA